MEQNLNETININKNEYDSMKEVYDNYFKLYNSDFFIKIKKGLILPKEHPQYYNGRIDIELSSVDFTKLNNYSIQINGKEYSIKSQNLFNKIKLFVSNNIDNLIDWSKSQTNDNLSNNTFEGGMGSSIQIKYGQLIINVHGQTMDLYEMCNEFIEEIKRLIIVDGEKTDTDFIKELIDKTEHQHITPVDEELEKYFKFYEEKFGKKAYIPEPHGTKEMAINTIKTCLEKNEDLLDKIYYPNVFEDSENSVLYSESQKELNKNKFLYEKNEIKLAKTQCELCKYNNELTPNKCERYPNGKLEEVISNTNKCNYLTTQNDIL